MLTLQFVPYTDIEHLDSEQRIKKLLKIVLENKIVVMQGRLKTEEEATLIKRTMEKVSRTFKGIELCTIFPDKKTEKGFKAKFINYLLGNREGLTIIGPATIVKEIKKNPNKIELLTQIEMTKKRK